MMFKDRADAGRVLAKMLATYKDKQAIVLALPNGGIPVAIEVALGLNAILRLMFTRRINFPFTTESGFGAVTADGHAFVDEGLAAANGIGYEEIERLKMRTIERLREKMAYFDAPERLGDIGGKTVIVTDDGIAGGNSMVASLLSITEYSPAKKIVAVPTAPARSIEKIKHLVDEIVCPDVQYGFSFAVANAYERWYDVPDDEAKQMLLEYQKK
jgi:putative phosphoribosyl transferase